MCCRYLDGFRDLPGVSTKLSTSEIAIAPKSPVAIEPPVSVPVSESAASPQAAGMTQIGSSAIPSSTLPPGFVDESGSLCSSS